MVISYKDMFISIGITWAKQIMFLGSGTTKPKSEWLNIPSIRTNNRTIPYYLDNPIFGIMTWPALVDEGSYGVVTKIREYNISPHIFTFVLDLEEQIPVQKTSIRYSDGYPIYIIGTKNRYKDESFADYVKISDDFGYAPRNSTGFYMILWLLYADVDEIYIAGYDGYKAYSGLDRGIWKVDKPFHDISGNVWCNGDCQQIKNIGERGNPDDFYYHNLTTEWLAIEKAIEKARDRGVKVFVAKDE
jgi:hypothetical protein